MRIALYLSLASLAAGQQAGTTVVEDPTQVEFSFRDCTSGSCSTKSKAITLDANWRWVLDEDKSGHIDEDELKAIIKNDLERERAPASCAHRASRASPATAQ